jgi:hypothetical protein
MEGGAFFNKRKFQDNPGRRRTFDKAFADYAMNGEEVSGLFRECGCALQCSRTSLGGWLTEAYQMFEDWKSSEGPRARKAARKSTKSRWECPANKAHHENIVVEMPLELRGDLDKLKKGCRLSRDKAAPAIIKAFRAKYVGGLVPFGV